MKNKNRFKNLIFILVILIFIPFSFSYGYNNFQDYGFFYNLVVFFNSIVDLLSLIWFVFPIISWKLLTNDFVYWTFMHMDIILWKIWNFSRILANFIIWFVFIYTIFKYLISLNDKNADILKKYLPKIALWSVVINISWFVIGVLIDISTILIISFGSLPAYISGNNIKNMKLSIATDYKLEEWCNENKKYCLGDINLVSTWEQKNIRLEKLLNYESNISWPLIFLMNSVLDITSISEDYKNQLNMNSKTFVDGWAFMKLLLKIIVIFLFLIPLFVLILINLVRIFYLRLYIGFGPLIFLDNIFGWKTIASKPAFKISNMIWLIFQPSIVVAAFSFWFIFLINVIWVINKSTSEEYKKYEEWILKTFNLEKSSAWVIDSDYFQVQDTTQKMSKYVWWFFGYLFILFLSISLVWSLIKLSFTSNEITSNISDKMFKFAEESFEAAPIIPTFWWWAQSVGSLGRVWSNVKRYPWLIQTKQARKLEEIFNTVIDIDPTVKKEYIRSLESIQKNYSGFVSDTDKDNLNKLFEQFNKYSWREDLIRWNKNTLDLLDKLIEVLKNKGLNYTTKIKTQWINDIISETDPWKKLKILLENESTAKKILLNEK